MSKYQASKTIVRHYFEALETLRQKQWPVS